MQDVRKIKALQSQLKQAHTDADLLISEIANKQRDLAAKKKTIKEIYRKIEQANKSSEIKVSEHAIVRYFERVLGHDIEAIEKQIVTPELLELVEKLGDSGGYPVGDFKVLIKDGTITTIII